MSEPNNNDPNNSNPGQGWKRTEAEEDLIDGGEGTVFVDGDIDGGTPGDEYLTPHLDIDGGVG